MAFLTFGDKPPLGLPNMPEKKLHYFCLRDFNEPESQLACCCEQVIERTFSNHLPQPVYLYSTLLVYKALMNPISRVRATTLEVCFMLHEAGVASRTSNLLA